MELSQAAREVEAELSGDAAQRATTPTTAEVENDIAAALRQASRYGNYPHISTLTVDVLNELDKLSWSDDLLTKLNSVLGNRTGLANELTQNLKLLNYFEGVNVNFWSKYGLLREHYRTGAGSLSLPNEFRGVVEDLEDIAGNKLSAVVGRTVKGNELSVLGGSFEDDVIHYVGRGFSNGGDFSHLPPSMKAQMDNLYILGYKVMVTQPNVNLASIGKTNAQPDILLFKVKSDNTINFNDVFYPDAKIHSTTEFSQKQIDFIDIIGSIDKVQIDRFAKTPQIFQPSGMSIKSDDFLNTDLTLKEAGKLCTQFQNDVVEFIYKKFR